MSLPLRDPAYFARLRADAGAGTIVWPNDVDIAPETLYAHAQQSIVTLKAVFWSAGRRRVIANSGQRDESEAATYSVRRGA